MAGQRVRATPTEETEGQNATRASEAAKGTTPAVAPLPFRAHPIRFSVQERCHRGVSRMLSSVIIFLSHCSEGLRGQGQENRSNGIVRQVETADASIIQLGRKVGG